MLGPLGGLPITPSPQRSHRCSARDYRPLAEAAAGPVDRDRSGAARHCAIACLKLLFLGGPNVEASLQQSNTCNRMPDLDPKLLRRLPRRLNNDDVLNVAVAANWQGDPTDVPVNAITMLRRWSLAFSFSASRPYQGRTPDPSGAFSQAHIPHRARCAAGHRHQTCTVPCAAARYEHRPCGYRHRCRGPRPCPATVRGSTPGRVFP